jgi:Rps23 Pro-64 3,4-dihydroxylase Tpa1-like proline 4-hydroxylase
MTDLYSYGYSDGPKGFWSHTEQINWHIDKFRDTNEAALDRNTDAIKEQTEQQRIDAEALRQTIDRQTAQQKADAEAGRNMFSDWMNKLVIRIKTIFSKDANDNETSYYEMMESEQKRMQAYVSAHTATVKSNADTTNERLQNIISELQEIQTNDDENANAIKNAINNLDLVVNNKIEYPRN